MVSLQVGQGRADAIVAQYIERYHGNSQAAQALCRELRGGAEGQEVPDLLDVLAHYDRSAGPALPSATIRQRISNAALPTPLLPGPLRYHITHTHSTLHPSNILLLRSILLPTRRFDTSLPDPDFVTSLTPCLLTSGADKRVLFSLPDSGEVIEALEPAARPGLPDGGHTAPVLDVAQHPRENRELITVGMDGRVILWDLLLRKPVLQRSKDHARFVVRCVWSEDGEWLATAGYDKKINIYQREVGQSDRMDDDTEEDGIEVQPLNISLTLRQSIVTQSNPEAIVFLLNDAQPPDVPGSTSPWLVWTQRDDCHVNCLQVGVADAQATSMRFNTNPSPTDTHVSYSLLSLALHPTLRLLSIVTGSHATEGAGSQILLLPLFSGERVQTIHTTLPSSSSFVPRQAWFTTPYHANRGEGVWVASEHGRLKLYDLATGEEKADIGVHGAASESVDGGGGAGMSAEEKAKRWRMGTMNGVIKDV